MSCSRSCNLCEAICNLLTVTMYLWNTLSRFHCPGLHKLDLRVHVASASTHSNPRAAELSVHSTIFPGEHLHNLLHWSLVAIPSQDPPTSAVSSDSPELKRTMFCFLEDAYTRCHVFSTEPLTQTAIPEWLRRSLTSPAQSASVIATTEPCGVPAIPGHRDCNQRSCCMPDFQSNISANA